jgi:PhnB protein
MTARISLMLAVEDAPAASAWYREVLGALELWSLGSVVGLELDGAPFFLHETTPAFVRPAASGTTTVRVEVGGAEGSSDEVRDHETPWGVHRQGRFGDPFGHVWHVGDRTPLEAHPAS